MRKINRRSKDLSFTSWRASELARSAINQFPPKVQQRLLQVLREMRQLANFRTRFRQKLLGTAAERGPPPASPLAAVLDHAAVAGDFDGAWYLRENPDVA